MRTRAFGLLGFCIVAGVVFGGVKAGADPLPVKGEITMTVRPRWGRATAGEWTTYTVSIRNDGGGKVDGDVVLVPEGPPPAPDNPKSSPPAWPAYRSPVTLYGDGGAKTLTTVLLESPFGYRAELRDPVGRLVASAPAIPPDPFRYSVALLSRVQSADTTVEGTPGLLQGHLAVTQFASGRGFPDDAIGFSGLDVVVIDDFDTGTLGPAQVGALRDFVSLGGSLVVAGGAPSSRTIGPLPPELAPLRPLSMAETSLAPLGDLVHQAAVPMATVTVGDVPSGRVVLGAKGAPPLVVEARLGAGRVVQLAYDPLAEPFGPDPILRAAAWDQGLTRVLPSTGFISQKPLLTPDNKLGPVAVGGAPRESADAPGSSSRPAEPDRLRPWPLWRWVLLIACLLFGPAYFVSMVVLRERRKRRPMRLATAVIVVMGTVAGGLAVGPTQLRGRTPLDLRARSETVFEIETLAGNGPMQATTFQQLTTERAVVPLKADVPASTVLVAAPGGSVPRTDFAGLYRIGPPVPATYGTGGGEVVRGAGGYELRRGDPPSKVRALQTIRVEHEQGGLEAELRQVGGSMKGDPGRVVGTVTNRGSRSLHRLRAQLPRSQALLADVVAPGAMVQVDVPLAAPIPWCLLPACPKAGLPARVRTEDAAMSAAASAAVRDESQLALVALIEAPSAGPGIRGDMPPIRIAVQTLPLAGFESGSFSPHPVAGGGPLGNLQVAAFEYAVPGGVGAPTFVSRAISRNEPVTLIEIFDWEAASWRPLPSPTTVADEPVVTPLRPTELNDGRVRMRSDPPVALDYVELDVFRTNEAGHQLNPG